MARIESYDFMVSWKVALDDMNLLKNYLNHQIQDSNNESLEKLIKQHSQIFDLTSPMKGCSTIHGRYLFLEGDMKYKDSTCKVSDYFWALHVKSCLS